MKITLYAEVFTKDGSSVDPHYATQLIEEAIQKHSEREFYDVSLGRKVPYEINNYTAECDDDQLD